MDLLNSYFEEEAFRIQKEKITDPNDKSVIWEEDPVDFQTFLHSPEHLAFKNYSERQSLVPKYMLGDDPKKIFENGKLLTVLEAGKGCASGETILTDCFTNQKFTIEELYKWKIQINVKCVDEVNKTFKIGKTSVPWVRGFGPLYNVKTRNGNSIIVYQAHKFLTPYGWKELSELKPGDWILSEDLSWDNIQEILFNRNDVFYDLEVPKYQNYLAHGLYNHNSGKDMLSCHLIGYVTYVLLCMKVPQAKFPGISLKDTIDCCNVAGSADQALNVFFEKFKTEVMTWRWLRKKYNYKISGKFYTPEESPDLFEAPNNVIINRNSIIFPKRIRSFSRNSDHESSEGMNLLMFVLDEYSSFKSKKTMKSNAEKIYNTLSSSATSRFGDAWKGFVVSYPRYKDDPIQKLRKWGENKLYVYTDRGATWEFKPPECFSGKFFTYNGRKIPLEYKKEYDRDPTNAQCKYECIPPEAEEAFIEKPERIDDAVDTNRKPICEFESYYENGYIKNRIVRWNNQVSKDLHVITIDLGLKQDRAALSVFHRQTILLPDRTTDHVFWQDAVVVWEPDPESGTVVDMNNVEEIIKEIAKKIQVLGAFFDQWNSAQLSQRLNNVGIKSDIYRLEFQDYRNLKEKLYFDKIELLNFPIQLVELKRLQTVKGIKVDHPDDGTKDVVDTIVGGVKVLSPAIQQGLEEEGEIVGDNLSMESGEVVGSEISPFGQGLKLHLP